VVLLMILLAWLPKLLIAAGLFILGLRAVRALERRPDASGELQALRDRVRALEDATTEQAYELRRIAAGQEFTEQFLARRSGSASGSSSDTPAT
jgi:hypothetical protein